ncbi:MAG: hypothetical protein ACKV2Q_07380 [Planctomycetaceae bacterium]
MELPQIYSRVIAPLLLGWLGLAWTLTSLAAEKTDTPPEGRFRERVWTDSRLEDSSACLGRELEDDAASTVGTELSRGWVSSGERRDSNTKEKTGRRTRGSSRSRTLETFLVKRRESITAQLAGKSKGRTPSMNFGPPPNAAPGGGFKPPAGFGPGMFLGPPRAPDEKTKETSR